MSSFADLDAAHEKDAAQTAAHADADHDQTAFAPLAQLHNPVGAAAHALGAQAHALAEQTRARAALQSRFQIVPDNYQGPRAPNTITQQVFNHLVDEYANIGAGRGDLTMDTSELSPEDARDWRGAMMNDVATVMQTETGRAEIDRLSNNHEALSGMHHHTTLRALHIDANGNRDRNDDDGAALDRSGGETIPVNPSASRTRVQNGQVVSGAGSDMIVRMTPGGVGFGDLIGDQRGDVVLSHELRHALDGTGGNRDMNTVGNDAVIPADRGLHESEYQAVGLGNYDDNTDINEEHYRLERKAIGQAHTPGEIIGNGALTGDAQMPLRRSYNQP
jgi:hypothetical protein